MAQAITEKFAYLKSSNFLRLWSHRECEVCEIEGVGLSMARAAPPLRFARPQAVSEPVVREVPEPKKKAPEDPYLNVFKVAVKAAHALEDFSQWLKQPPAPRSPAEAKARSPQSAPASAVKKVPPFDIQDIPKAMRKLHMPMAAKLQERWFAGQENYSQSPGLLQKEIDQNGLRYSLAMVDTTTVKMDWVLSFARAKRVFDKLISDNLQSPGAIDTLRRQLTPYKNRREVLGWNVAQSDFFEYHRRFQFQRAAVNATWGQRISEYLVRTETAGGVPDDLTGALGSFNFYAAVRYAYFDHPKRHAVVTDVSVYVRDPYEFSDDQYLGHWSASHVAVVPAHQLAAGSGWLAYPVVDGSIHEKDNVLYPVTNGDYRNWRQKHGRGGDFMIYTDRISVRLARPIRIAM